VDAHLPVSHEQADGLVFEGAADADVDQAAHVAQGDPASRVDPVLSHATVDGRLSWGGVCFEPGVKDNQRGVVVEGLMRPVLVVIGAKRVELKLEDGE
jgi:hypothetical protein